MEIWGQFAAVALVLTSLLGLLWWGRRTGWASISGAGFRTPSRDKSMRLIERLPISANHTLLLVEIEGTRMLVCLSPGSSTVTRLSA